MDPLPSAPAWWLMKSEPQTFSIQMLAGCDQATEPWNGVRNYQARNYLRAMRVGDCAFFYHSSCPVPGVVGWVEIVKAAYPDPTQWDPDSDYWDPKSPRDNPRWVMVDVQLRGIFPQGGVSLARLKQEPDLAQLPLVRQRCRLSVMPVQPEEAACVWRCCQIAARE